MKRIGRGARLGAIILAQLALIVSARSAGAEDSWDAIYIAGQKVGHTHIRVEPVQDSQGRGLLRVQVNQVIDMRRGDDRVNMELRYGTIETPDGSVLRLDTRTRAGREELRTYGDVADGTMQLTLDGGGASQKRPIPWGPEVRGPYAAELSLARSPIQPGESRSLKMFLPTLNQVCTTHLHAKQTEEVALGGGVKRTLLRVEQTIDDANGRHMPELDTTFWIDSSGQILRSHTDFLGGMESYRTTRAAALASNGDFDLLDATILRGGRRIPNSEQTRHVLYRVTFKGGDPAEIFPEDSRQTLTPGSESGVATLEVRTVGRDAGASGPAEVAPEYREPNPLINSTDARVIAHMKKAVGDRQDPWQKAVAIQNWVFNNLRKKNFGTAFASASEVADDLQGDCTEHGVLTAAMCRAAGVPCRVVVGLVYVESLGGFGPHLWNEVYVDGRWVAIDSTFNQSEVDATHLKLAESSLDGVAPFEAFLPVTRVFNQLTIEATEIR